MAGTNNVNRNRNGITLKIWQQNVNKSSTCQHDLISSARLAKEGIDIVALQEPCINYYGSTVTTKDWTIVYPTTHALEPTKTRSLILIRANIRTDSWKQIDISTGDVTAVKITGDWGTLTLCNVYNDCTHDQTLEVLSKLHRQHETETSNQVQEFTHLLWVGDFNRHHPHWDNPADTRLFTTDALDRAEKLIRVIANAGLDLALPPHIATHLHSVTKRWTRLDHVLLSDHSFDAIVSCDVLNDTPGINTDHLPILTNLDFALAKAPDKWIANYRDVDWDKFRNTLGSKMLALGLPKPLDSQMELDEVCKCLTKAIQDTIEEVVPTSEIGPMSKRWWTKELTILRRKANGLGRKASKMRDRPDNPVHAEHTKAKKMYSAEIENCKKHHWRDWLEKAEDPDIWTAHRYISSAVSDGSKTRIPTLSTKIGGVDRTANTNAEKSKALAATFFPSKATGADRTIGNIAIPDQVCIADPITRAQIKHHMAKLKPYKAPGPDGIPNIVLTKCADILSDRLYHIYTAMFEKDLFYAPWKQFTTIVLRKPGKPKYNIPKAYRPIALLNTMVKVLTAVLVEQLMYYAEKYQLLPANHFGGRKGRTATDAVHLLVHNIKDAWRKGKVMAVLFLDIEGAFPNADNDQLARNLAARRIPNKLIKFIANMLKDRTTTLKFDDYASEVITLNNGIGQGDPLSMALYQFYNADLVDIPEDKTKAAEAYVDDAILTATADTFQEAHQKLRSMMTREGGAIEWTEKHNSRFEYSKIALIDFAHSNKKTQRPPLALPEITIEPTTHAKYLGVILDQNLRWKEQAAYAIGKGTTWAAQIRRATRPSWGLTPRAARRLYIGVALPRILYGLETWCSSPQDVGQRGSTAAIGKLTSIQREGTLAITGGLQTSPTDSLDAHASMLPMKLRVGKICHNSAVRIASLPRTHPLHKSIRRAARRQVKRHRAPLHNLAASLNVDPDMVETIPPVRANPAYRKTVPVRLDIPSDKDASKRTDTSATEVIKVYTDGSSHNGKVGAAAILLRQGKPARILKLHLGTAEEHTVYEAELVGLLLGLHLISTETNGRKSCVIGADNQAALTAIHSDMTKPGQHIAAEFLRIATHLDKKRGKNYSLALRWTAGHVGIEGNEKADEEAKSAADGQSSVAADLSKFLRKKIKRSTSALKQAYNEKAKNKWKAEWHTSKRYKRFPATDIISPSSKKFLKLISDRSMSRKTASRIFQLRVGHVPLNEYLHRFKKTASAGCPACGGARETVAHFMLHCPSYAYERWALLKYTRDTVPKLEDILSNPKASALLSSYIDATGRFEIDQQ